MEAERLFEAAETEELWHTKGDSPSYFWTDMLPRWLDRSVRKGASDSQSLEWPSVEMEKSVGGKGWWRR